MAGAPYYLDPLKVVKEWTLPQLCYTWVIGKDQAGAEGKQTFLLSLSAIQAALQAAFGKNGKSIVQRVINSLSGPGKSLDNVVDQMTDEQLLILTGRTRPEKDGSKNGN